MIETRAAFHDALFLITLISRHCSTGCQNEFLIRGLVGREAYTVTQFAGAVIPRLAGPQFAPGEGRRVVTGSLLQEQMLLDLYVG